MFITPHCKHLFSSGFTWSICSDSVPDFLPKLLQWLFGLIPLLTALDLNWGFWFGYMDWIYLDVRLMVKDKRFWILNFMLFSDSDGGWVYKLSFSKKGFVLVYTAHLFLQVLCVSRETFCGRYHLLARLHLGTFYVLFHLGCTYHYHYPHLDTHLLLCLINHEPTNPQLPDLPAASTKNAHSPSTTSPLLFPVRPMI